MDVLEMSSFELHMRTKWILCFSENDLYYGSISFWQSRDEQPSLEPSRMNKGPPQNFNDLRF